MGRPTAIPALLALAVTLAACGPPMGWQKPGVSLADAEADSRECRELARRQALRDSFFGPGYYGPGYPGSFAYGGNPMAPYGPYGYRRSGYYDSYMWQSQREGELQDFCLRSRGYSLQPIPQ